MIGGEPQAREADYASDAVDEGPLSRMSMDSSRIMRDFMWPCNIIQNKYDIWGVARAYMNFIAQSQALFAPQFSDSCRAASVHTDSRGGA
jgi:hypothetical protein